MKEKARQEKGITLVALIITIIVLVILAAVSIAAVYNSKIVDHAINGSYGYSTGSLVENNIMTGTENLIDSTVDRINSILAGNGNTPEGDLPTEEPPAVPTGSQVTLADGTAITKSNVAGYLGKKVTNYTGQSSISVDGTTYTVSPEYRLYYIDFDNKYKDGEGTIYLKAECTSNDYALKTDTSSATDDGIKIDELNPSLYADGVTPPSSSNSNMQAVTWLTNTSKWDGLKDTSFASKVNYVVGAPSLEMFMDSYNTHYGLLEGTLNTGALSSGSDRVKLFYQYPFTGNSYNYGYAVGPSTQSNTSDGFATSTIDFSVQADAEIGSMWYPGYYFQYKLASPSANDDNYVVAVTGLRRGIYQFEHLGLCRWKALRLPALPDSFSKRICPVGIGIASAR